VLEGITFTSTTSGTAVGQDGLILHTEDGGSTWVRQDSGTIHWLYAVDFTDEDTGVVVGEFGVILRTADRGKSWTYFSHPSLSGLKAVQFIGSYVGVAVGGSSILRTTDGGDNWTLQVAPTAGPWGYFGVAFVDANTGTVVGYQGTILHTTSGGD
jgi:photosystem II stability/assembly factor-like uncharacterized protein